MVGFMVRGIGGIYNWDWLLLGLIMVGMRSFFVEGKNYSSLTVHSAVPQNATTESMLVAKILDVSS